MAIIIALFSFLIVSLFCALSACAISSDLSRQEEREEAQRKFRDGNKK